ncbi:MAG: NADH-quinone oxidoreductase subunit J [Chlamydiales bacterium]|nr:NADH-quinone oxidoreductase subunit J [Chlamydiales bacterium]
MPEYTNLHVIIVGFLLICSSLGVILVRKPVHSSLFFLVSLMLLATLYLWLSATFIATMQVLVYAGAILVIFMFVIVLFQDAHEQLNNFPSLSRRSLVVIAAVAFFFSLMALAARLYDLVPFKAEKPEGFGTVQSLGETLYVDFFFPFEAVVLLFLIAIIGSVYIAKKEPD